MTLGVLRMRHIIIEGPDGAGKTRLARELCERYEMAYRHEGPPPPDANVYRHYLLGLVEAEEPTVFDRYHLGEIVYGPLLREGSKITLSQIGQLNRLATTILCLPPWDVAFANTRGRKELIENTNLLRTAYHMWTLVATNKMLTENVTVFDYTRGPYVTR